MKKSLLFLFLACFITQAHATIHTVNNESGSSADFTNIAGAIGAAVAGDTIYVQPSLSTYGDMFIDKSLVIMGAGHNPNFSPYNSQFQIIQLEAGSTGTIIKGLNAQRIQSTASSTINNIVISGCRISGSSTSPLLLSAGSLNNWIFEGCIIESLSASYVSCSNLGANLIFRNNFILSVQTPYVIVNIPNGTVFDHNLIVHTQSTTFGGSLMGTNILATNNIFTTQGTSNSSPSAVCNTCTFNNNLTYSMGGGNFPTLSGANNVNNANPGFPYFYNASTYQYDYNFTIQTNSPAYNAASDGTSIGLYGGIFQFDPNGIDGGTPHINSFSLDSATAPQGGTITIHLNASGSGQ